MLNIKKIPLTSIAQNSRIIWDDKTKEALIVDPGEEREELVSFINDNNLKLKYILLTHSHFDHCGGVSFLISNFKDCKLLAAENEKFFRENVKELIDYFGVPPYKCSNCKEPDIFLKDNLEIFLGEEKIICISTPGHSCGGFCFYNEENKILISGDTLFRNSIGRTDLEYANFEDIIKSIKTKLLVLPEDTLVMPGHGEDSTIGHEKKFNPYIN